MKQKLLLTLLFLLGVSILNGQELTVSGRVTSADDGLGIPGVSVYIKGT